MNGNDSSTNQRPRVILKPDNTIRHASLVNLTSHVTTAVSKFWIQNRVIGQ